MACAYGRNELALLWYAGHYVTGDVDTAYLQSLEDSVRQKTVSALALLWHVRLYCVSVLESLLLLECDASASVTHPERCSRPAWTHEKQTKGNFRASDTCIAGRHRAS